MKEIDFSTGKTKEVTWQDAVVDCAQRFSKEMESSFVAEMRRVERFLPHATAEESKAGRQHALECFLDYLVGTSIAIATTYASDEKVFEENLITVVRDKFARIREMNTNKGVGDVRRN